MENNILLREPIEWTFGMELPKSLQCICLNNKNIELTPAVKRIIKRQRRSLFGIKLKKGLL